MKNNKRPSNRMRFLAWLMAAIMMCTGLNVTAYAQEISFDDGYALEQQEEQVEDEGTAEEIQQDDADDENISDADISFEDSEDTEDEEITIEDAQDEEDAEETDVFTDADSEDATAVFSDTESDTEEGTATATVYFSFSQDANYADSSIGSIKAPVALQKLIVPYFDLAKYGLEDFYFNSENYSSSGADKGTAETAYNHVTLLHLLIYATETLYMGIPEDQAGQGYLYNEGYLKDGSTLSISGSSGSMFIQNIWGFDLNLLYYKNYEYPTASEGWGSTADQILVDDGDVITLAHFTDWSFFMDSAAGFNFLKIADSITEASVDRGTTDEIPIEVYRSVGDMNAGSSEQKKMTGEYQIYYTPVSDMLDGDVSTWTLLGTTTDGTLNVDLDSIPNGEYFVGIPGLPGADYPDATCSSPGGIYLNVTGSVFEGQGTAEDPYKLSTAEDLTKLKNRVKAGKVPENTYFVLTDDITLPEGWTPIGETIDGSNDIKRGQNLRAFSGILDGQNHTITVPEGGLPLLGYVKGAEVRNLNIYGTKIAGYGLINNFEGVGLSGNAVLLDNITLKSGSSTLKSGLLGANITTNQYAGCSAGFLATVQNCTIEDNVVIGYDKDQSVIGSFAGRFIGTISNCTSNATVYGVNYVGGIIGMRDNSMQDNFVEGCTFNGTVEASGKNAGGIVAGGYMDNYPEDYAWGMSAPNAYRLNINNCTSTGIITGTDNVGGIFGGDIQVAQAWNAYTFKNNTFTGKVSATEGTNVGGVIGYYRSLNKFDDITGNTFSDDCGTTKGIGGAEFVDTSCETHETESGATYFNTANGTTGLPSVKWCSWKKDHNRTDDPLGADAANLTEMIHVHHVWDEGKVTKEPTCAEEGVMTYTCTVCQETKTEPIAKTEDHQFTWKTIAAATVFAPEKQQGTCEICGATATRDNGKKLPATIKLNVTSIKLQQKQSTNKIKVTAMTKGDSVKSWESNNQKIATVSKSGVIKAGKKNGTARITVTLASGKKATVTVKVQKAKVATTKISGLKSKETLKKGKKLTLKPVISPITSLEKVTYTSSNKKVATVNSKGVVTAKKKGTAKITVKSGKKSYTIKVTVK